MQPTANCVLCPEKMGGKRFTDQHHIGCIGSFMLRRAASQNDTRAQHRQQTRAGSYHSNTIAACHVARTCGHGMSHGRIADAGAVVMGSAPERDRVACHGLPDAGKLDRRQVGSHHRRLHASFDVRDADDANRSCIWNAAHVQL
ncbi:hypothetical protein D3C71_1361930 [compost metagenome]